MPTNLGDGRSKRGADPLVAASSVSGRRSTIPQADPVDLHSEKGNDNLYQMTNLPFGQKDIQKRYDDILGPLSLFAPFAHEDVIVGDTIEMERPVTPINEEIKAAPFTFNQLANYVRRRITADPQSRHLSVEDQQGLAAILMGEVNGIWPDIRRQVDDPFLTPEQNKELQRRISVHIVTVCETLFGHYVEKAQILNKRGVFSGPANMSRLKAQLALDANKFLNILIIRRYLVGDMRGKQDHIDDLDEKPDRPSQSRPSTQKLQRTPALSYQRLVVSSRPKDRHKRGMARTIEDDILEIQEQMPTLPTEKIIEMIDKMGLEKEKSLFSESSGSPAPVSNIYDQREDEIRQQRNEELSRTLLKRHDSLGEIAHIETLAEELDMSLQQVHQRPNTATLENMPSMLKRKEKLKKEETEKEKEKPVVLGNREYAANDLKKLCARSGDNEPDDEPDEDLPPLLQALTRSAKHDGMKEKHKKKIKELEDKEKEELENLPIIRQPAFPQPDTVSTKLPNKMLVRTSDIRVSERVCMSNVTVKKHETVYNDLLGEIDQATLLKMDKNLFLGDEIKEVYKEIMQTVPTDHLELENDVLIEPAADAVNLSSILMPSALAKKKKEKFVNSSLQKSKVPPWGDEGNAEWAKNPASQLKDMRGELHGADEKDVLSIPGKVLTMDEYKAQLEEAPRMVQERLSRNYASWLAWWKSTMNTDDYMKYLSSQESDYMGYIFHFYDSEDEDDEESRARKTALLTEAEQKKKEKKVKELRKVKTEFTPGVWNFNSILMGGLGKDPELEEEDHETARSETTEDAKSARSSKAFIAKKSTLRSRDGSLASFAPEGASRKRSDTGDRSRMVSRATERTSFTTATEPAKSPEASEPVITPQDRLEKVWTLLQMPDALKLDMAIKYSTDDYLNQLEDAIDSWETATKLIIKREAIMKRLETFERLGSDPNRFFDKSSRGSSVARLEEARVRSGYYKKLESMESKIRRAVEDVRDEFKDTITYQGRPYLDKMHWDRIEMLYWLQEERKQSVLEKQAIVQGLPLKITQLEPIQTPTH